jgi:hypothetical protein
MDLIYVDSDGAIDNPLVNRTGPGHNRWNISFSKSELSA